jgi:hypothetical protein
MKPWRKFVIANIGEACCNASSIFESCEKTFDIPSLFVDDTIINMLGRASTAACPPAQTIGATVRSAVELNRLSMVMIAMKTEPPILAFYILSVVGILFFAGEIIAALLLYQS